MEALPLHRFLNFVYRAMLQRLDYNEEGDVRGQLDLALETSTWRVPGRDVATSVERIVEVDGEKLKAPAWWRSDEDASQSFLASMGVQLDG